MGPTWLRYPENQWQVLKIPDCKTAEFESELKGSNIMFEASLLSRADLSREVPQLFHLSDIDGSRCSSLLKLLRVTAWILRFVNILKRESCSGPLTAMELQKARLLWDIYIQYKKYSDILRGSKNNNLKNQLNLQQDTNGLLQCHGRFGNATSLNQLTKFQKLQPKDEYCTKFVIENCHRRVLHAGVSQTLAQLKLEYWVPYGRSIVRKILKQCKVCCRCEGSCFALSEII